MDRQIMTINTNVHFTCISEQSIMQALVDVDYAPIYRPGNQRLSIVALGLDADLTVLGLGSSRRLMICIIQPMGQKPH